MSKFKQLEQKANDAVANLIGYTEVSKQTTLEAIEELMSTMETMADALRTEIEAEEQQE